MKRARQAPVFASTASTPEDSSPLWKLGTLLLLLAYAVIFWRLQGQAGWDALMYRTLHHLFREGVNIYSIDAVRSTGRIHCPSTYPPLIVALAHPLLTTDVRITAIICFCCLVLGWYLLAPRNYFASLLILGGFSASLWTISSLNYAFIEFALFAIALRFYESRTRVSAVSLGLAAYLKIQNLAFLPFALIFAKHRSDFLITILTAQAILWGLSFGLYPTETTSFLILVYELSNPAFYDANLRGVSDGTIWTFIGRTKPYGLIPLIVVITLLGTASRATCRDDTASTKRLSWSILGVALLLPRFAEYSAMLGLPAFVILSQQLSDRKRTLLVAMSVFLPLAMTLELRLAESASSTHTFVFYFLREHKSILGFAGAITTLSVLLLIGSKKMGCPAAVHDRPSLHVEGSSR